MMDRRREHEQLLFVLIKAFVYPTSIITVKGTLRVLGLLHVVNR